MEIKIDIPQIEMGPLNMIMYWFLSICMGAMVGIMVMLLIPQSEYGQTIISIMVLTLLAFIGVWFTKKKKAAPKV